MTSFRKDNKTEPDPNQAILGYRVWKVTVTQRKAGSSLLDKFSLQSLYQSPKQIGSEWSTTMKAICLAQERHSSPPAADCRCGLHAYYKLGPALKEHYLSSKGPRGVMSKSTTQTSRFWFNEIRFNVIGGIAGKGRTRLHRRGFRSSEAQIIALAPLSKQQAFLTARLAEKMNVKFCKDIAEIERFCESVPVTTMKKDQPLFSKQMLKDKIAAGLIMASLWGIIALGVIPFLYIALLLLSLIDISFGIPKLLLATMVPIAWFIMVKLVVWAIPTVRIVKMRTTNFIYKHNKRS